MGIRTTYNKLLLTLKKYRYVVLVLVIGLFLLLMPDVQETPAVQEPTEVNETNAEEILEMRLSQILSEVDGAGPVQVMLTVAAGEEVIYQVDSNSSYHADTNTVNSSTVMVTNADRSQTGLIRQKIPAVYQGAIVVCGGADKPGVQLAIVEAVSKMTGLGANHISVLKMKQ